MAHFGGDERPADQSSDRLGTDNAPVPAVDDLMAETRRPYDGDEDLMSSDIAHDIVVIRASTV